MRPDFNFIDVDLVANRNTFRKLLNFAEGRARESFRIDLQMVENTLFMSRRERKTTENLKRSKDPCFGHSFETAFSVPQSGLENSTSHHRVINYTLGNLNCVVRFEVDACCDNPSGMLGSNEQECHIPSQQGEEGVLASLAQLSLTEGEKSTGREEPQRIQVIERGSRVPTTKTAEVKTRSKPKSLRDTLPQLWFGRTPHLRIGTHTMGTFTDVESIDAAANFPEWEERYQDSLRRMVSLISEIREVVKGVEGGRCAAVYNHKVKPPQLELVTTRADNDILPARFIRQFWRKDDNTSSASQGNRTL